MVIVSKCWYYLRHWSAVLVMFFLILAVVEGIMRWKASAAPETGFEIKQDNGLRILRPGVNQLIRSDSGVPIRVKTNAEGFASDDHAISAATNTKRIAFMGNSFIQGHYVDHDKKITELLKRLYPKSRDGQAVEIMNFGVVGASIVEQLFYYEHYVKKYHPDTVILQIYIGYDIASNVAHLGDKAKLLETKTSSIPPESILRPVLLAPSSPSLRRRLAEEMEILRYSIRLVRRNDALYAAAVKLGLLQKPFTERAADYYSDVWGYLNPESGDHRAVTEFAADLIDRLRQNVHADGGSFALMIIPSYWQVDNKFVRDLKTKGIPIEPTLPNAIVSARLQSLILDLSERLAKDINENKIQVFINDTGHFTEYGNALAAEEIAHFLEVNAHELGL